MTLNVYIQSFLFTLQVETSSMEEAIHTFKTPVSGTGEEENNKLTNE